MNVITNQVGNRDIALFVWLTIFVIFLLVNRSIRQSLMPLLRVVFLNRKITPLLLVMLAYIALVVASGYRVGVWQPWMLKDTLYWCFGTALTTFFNLNKASNDEHFFRKAVLDNLRFAALLAFFVNLYVFPLVVELVLLPFMTLLGGLLVVADSKKEYAPVKTVLQWLVAIIGFCVLTYVGAEAFSNRQRLATVNNLEDFLLPLALTIPFLFFIYGIALYSSYELLYVRLKIFGRSRDKGLAKFALWQVVKICHLRLGSIRQFSDSFAVQLGGAENTDEIVAIISEFRARSHSHKP